MSKSLIELTLTEIAPLLESGETTSTELCQAYLAQVDAIDHKIKAFNSIDRDAILRSAEESDTRRKNGTPKSRYDGIPIGIKDLIAVRDQPLTCSSKILSNFISPYDATVIEKLRTAGWIPFGRLNMDEFAMGSSTENSATQKTSNPWDHERIPGGSSGGSASAVAARECPVTLGSDTGGSIRQPASLCGIVGLKPTYGRVSRFGLAAFASSLDQIGPMGKTVEDVTVVFEAICGIDERDSTSADLEKPDLSDVYRKIPYKGKIGLPREYFGEGIDPEVRQSIDESIELLKQSGCEFVEISLPNTQYAVSTYYIIATAEASSNLSRYDGIRYGKRSENAKDGIDLYFKSRGEGFGEEVKRRIILGTYVLSSGYYDAWYLKALKVRNLIQKDFLKAFESVDAILTPTAPGTAFKFGEKADDPLSMYLADIFTISTNLAGLPGISVPSGLSSEGLPIGVQFIGKPFAEKELLQLAQHHETLKPFTAKPKEF